MGLFGALSAGVSGLDSQSNKISIISNNISNVNTVGYKQGQADFDTLVVPSGTTSFSPGGVIGGNAQLVNQQGTISATQSSTDVAVSGGGMIFVSASPTGGQNSLLFTRAGDFTQDAEGNFVNSDGYYLQGLPIDSTTGAAESVNTQNLQTVNVSSSATGKPTATSTLTLGANFNASQTALLGPGETVSLSGNNNVGATASQIIVGNDVYGQNTNSGIVRGNSFSITTSSTSQPATFVYGGFSIGRNVTTDLSSSAASLAENVQNTATPPVTGALGDGNNVLDTEAGQTLTVTGDTATITVTNPSAYANATSISLSGITTNIDGATPAQLNGEWTITGGQGTGTLQIQLGTGTAGTGAPGGTATVSNRTANFAGNIMDAKSTTDDFLKTTGTSGFTNSALDFSIEVATVGTTKLKYSSNPDPQAGTFNSLSTLSEAINDATGSGLTSSVVNGRIYISATNPDNAVTYINGDATGNASTAVNGEQLAGINWVQELDLPAAGTKYINNGNSTTPDVHYFNTLSSLANAINSNDAATLTASITDPTGNSTMTINEANAQQTISFADGNPAATPAVTNTVTGDGLNTGGSLLKEFSFLNSTGGTTLTGTFPNLSTGTLGETYNASDPKLNMSSGAVPAQYTKDITIYDSLGQAHTIAMNVSKLDTATATWAVEFTAVPASDVVSDDGSTGSLADGQIAAGTVQFNGNGEITSASPDLQNFDIIWNQQTVGASPSPISVDLGLGGTNSASGVGLTQASGAFNVSTAQQNGAPTGELTGVSIDENGFVIAAFSNGQTQKMFQIPLANFTNPDGLLAVSGNAYQATISSGPVNPELAGTSGVGTFTPSALEQSNVDLSTQLTDLIVAQQAYGANSKVLTVADSLLQELDQIIQ